MFGNGAVGVGRCAGNIALVFEALAEFVVATTDMFAQDVAAGGFVLAEVARRPLPGAIWGIGSPLRSGRRGPGVLRRWRASRGETGGRRD